MVENILLEDLRLNPHSFLLSKSYVKIHGEDAAQYLHSQTTNNVQALSVNEFHFNSILDLSGKIISSFILCKKGDHEFYLITQDQFIESTIERIEKFHIAEEFEVEVIQEKVFLNLNSKGEGFKGSYFFQSDNISIGNAHAEVNTSDFSKLKTFTGVPELGVEASPGDLINNTRFDELSIDYSKGCYPGQETVSKVDTRRGAAYKPVLILVEGKNLELRPGDEVKLENKKIGKVLNSLSLAETTYINTSVLREYRVDKSSINFSINDQDLDGKIYYYPFISQNKEDLAQELYDFAVEKFHNNENELAIEYFQKAISTNPKFEDAYESLGVLYGRLEKYDMAIKLMEELKNINEKCMMAYTNLSLYHMKIGNIAEAETYKSEATLLNFELLGDEADRKRKEEELKAKREADIKRREGMFLQVLDMDPEDAMANNGMGEIELDRGNYEASEVYFKNAIKGDKKYSVAYLGLCKSLYQQSKIDELKEQLELGITIAGKNGDLMPANEMQALKSKL